MVLDNNLGIDTRRNVILHCDDRSSNGCIVGIEGITYVISVGHGVLSRMDAESPIKLRGSLEIKLYDGTPITWTKLHYETSERCEKGYCDSILIEVVLPAGLQPSQLSLTPSFNMKLANVACLGKSKFLVKGRIVAMTDYEACIPAFSPSGASGLGLLDSSQAVVGVIRATSDQHDRIHCMMFAKGLNAARHKHIYTEVVLSKSILSILNSSNRKEILPCDSLSEDAGSLKRARSQSSPGEDKPRAQGLQARWVRGIAGAMRDEDEPRAQGRQAK